MTEILRCIAMLASRFLSKISPRFKRGVGIKRWMSTTPLTHPKGDIRKSTSCRVSLNRAIHNTIESLGKKTF